MRFEFLRDGVPASEVRPARLCGRDAAEMARLIAVLERRGLVSGGLVMVAAESDERHERDE